MADNLRAALDRALGDELGAALSRIEHCVNQLTAAQVWARPPQGTNAVGNLLLHLAGNLRQMVVSNLTGAPDARDRPAEFTRTGVPAGELLVDLARAVQAARDALAAASDARLCEQRRAGPFDWTGIQAVVRSVAHFRGHTQEIIHITRTILGDGYEFAGPR